MRPQLPANLFIYLLVLLTGSLHAYRVDFIATRRPVSHHNGIYTRASDGAPLNNSADISYHVDLVLGGETFRVLLDTGSSDLWVAGNVAQGSDTGLTSGVSYAIGGVKGPIKTAHLEFADYQVENQAFLQVPPSSSNPDGTGILGLGPSSGSFVFAAMQDPAGAPVLDRIFLQNITVPNYFTILLDRNRDPTTSFTGTITIGSALPNFDQILNEPKLPISLVQNDAKDQHFQVLLDPNGIIGPDGKSIAVRTAVQGNQQSQFRATAVLDCGFSLPQVPRTLADAIYSKFEGAEFTALSGLGAAWVLPCEQEVNVTFIFGGKNIPMHPLDMTLDPEVFGLNNVTNSAGTPVCIGSFQPFAYDRGPDPTYDMVLGMAFMRNTYTLFDYGDFILGTNTTGDPYIQLLSITDIAEAHQDFVKVRLGGVDTTRDHVSRQSTNSGTPRTVYYIVAAIVAAVVLALAIGGFLSYRARRSKKL